MGSSLAASVCLLCIICLAQAYLTGPQKGKFDFVNTLQSLIPKVDGMDQIGPSAHIEKYESDPAFRESVNNQIRNYLNTDNHKMDPEVQKNIMVVAKQIQEIALSHPSENVVQHIREILRLLAYVIGSNNEFKV